MSKKYIMILMIIGFIVGLILMFILTITSKKYAIKHPDGRDAEKLSSRVNELVTKTVFLLASYIFNIIIVFLAYILDGYKLVKHQPVLIAICFILSWFILRCISRWVLVNKENTIDETEMTIYYIMSIVAGMLSSVILGKELSEFMIDSMMALLLSTFIPIGIFFSRDKIDIKRGLSGICNTIKKYYKDMRVPGAVLLLVICMASIANIIPGINYYEQIFMYIFNGFTFGMLIYIIIYRFTPTYKWWFNK